jgi:mannose-6-phosphate isomerase-like protein (cupin superfamily)
MNTPKKTNSRGRREHVKIGEELAKYLFIQKRETSESSSSHGIVTPNYTQYEKQIDSNGESRQSWATPFRPSTNTEAAPRLIVLQKDRIQHPGKPQAYYNFETLDATPPRKPHNSGPMEAAYGQFVKRSSNDTQEMHRHLGEELIILVSGRAQFNYFDGNTVILESGDAIWFRSEMYHELYALSEESSRAIVIWWAPEFSDSKIQGLRSEKKETTNSLQETFARANKRSTPQYSINSIIATSEDRDRYVKFCHGVPDMILHYLKRIGRDETSLRAWLNRADRSIDEILRGTFDISEEALKTLAANLQVSPAQLFWRFSDKNEPWCTVLRAKHIEWTLPKHAVIKIDRLDLGGPHPYYHTVDFHRATSDHLFLALTNAIRADGRRNANDKPTTVTADQSQVIFVPHFDGEITLFPDRQNASALQVSINTGAAGKLNKSATIENK